MKIKIAIVGMGGIGGYIGAKLSNHFENNDQVDIYFIARGAHLEKMRCDGLTLITPNETITTRPTLATDNTSECGAMDYIFYCTKNYDIATTSPQLLPMLKKESVIIPILNGVSGVDELRELFPANMVCDGLAFIVSSIKSIGVVEMLTPKEFHYFGDGNSDTLLLKVIEQLSQEAGINLSYSPDIKRRVWEKFEFISTIASITTVYNITYGEVLNSEKYMAEYTNLLHEFDNVAIAKGVFQKDDDRIAGVIAKARTIFPEATTSMQRDFWSNRKSERDYLTAYIIIEGAKLNIPTPQYSAFINMLRAKD